MKSRIGQTFKVYKAKTFKKPPKYFHSVHGVGKLVPDPEKKNIVEKDLLIDLGEVKSNIDLESNNISTELNYNEYVVYDVGQVNIT